MTPHTSREPYELLGTDPGDNMLHADKELVDRLIGGDEKAFNAFFSSHFPRLFRFALPRVRHDHDLAEEVVQETLCKAMTKLGSYRGEAALFTWLCTFCRHEISAVIKRDERIDRSVDLREDDPDIRAILESLSAIDTPDTEFQHSEIARLVRVTLDHIPALYGDVLEWKYIHGLSVKEIASRIERGPKAAESVLTRAREAFRDGFTTLVGDGQSVLDDGPIAARTS